MPVMHVLQRDGAQRRAARRRRCCAELSREFGGKMLEIESERARAGRASRST